MQNKFGKDAANPSSGSNWSARRMLFIAGVYFLVGAIVGSDCLWMIVAFRTGMSIPLMSLFSVVLIEFVLYLITVKCLSDRSVMAGIFQDKKRRTLRAVYFLVGAIVASDCLWTIVALRCTGIAISLLPFFSFMLIEVVCFLITVKCLSDRSLIHSWCTPKQELKDAACLTV
jgi:hypothetical protein